MVYTWPRPPWWPFGAREPEPVDEPVEIPIFETDFEGTITLILERARDKAAQLPQGSEFEIDASNLIMGRAFAPIEVVGPVMFRAGEYGLSPGMCVNGKFSFTKL